MSLFRTLLFLSLLSIHAPALRAQELDVFVGEQLNTAQTEGRSIGMDDQRFYLLRIEQERRESLGYLEGWSRETLQREFSAPLSVPVVNADEFKVLEFVSEEGRLRIFYSFFSKTDGQLTLAMATFDNQGQPVGSAVKLMTQEGKREDKAGYFIINHDQRSHLTLIMSVRNAKGMLPGYFDPNMRVAVMNAQGELVSDRTITTGDYKYTILQRILTDRTGNVYLSLSNYGKDKSRECTSGILVVNDANPAGRLWCQLTAPEDTYFRNDAQFVTDNEGDLHYVRSVGGKDMRLEAVEVASFDHRTGERTDDRLYRFTSFYPADVKHGKKDPFFMQMSNVLDYSFQPDGRLNVYGEEVFAKVGSGGEDSFWGVSLDLNTGFGTPWSCRVKRKYHYVAGRQVNLFEKYILNIKGADYLLANELRDNIGKSCSAMQDWKMVNGTGGDTVPAYVRLNGDDGVGMRERLTATEAGEDQYVNVLWGCSIPGQEYILRLKSDETSQFVRVRSAH